jgi:tRNA nucleotidyltransferase (CCA-adding enzyme)
MMNLFEIENSIDMEKFSEVFTPDVKKVIEIIRKYGFDLRVVGGAVRDFVLGKVPRDIDFATDADPAELIFIFDLEGIQYDAWGIKHGTIKAVFGDSKVDVTSISYRLILKNDKVSVVRTKTWEEDSSRRDLTVNSMSVDMDGTLYDYQDGLKDIKDKRIKFCPGVEEKIEQDPYIILRWFKAFTFFDDPVWMKRDQQIVEKNADKVKQVKDEDRTKLFLSGLLTSPYGKRIFAKMCKMGVAQNLDINC